MKSVYIFFRGSIDVLLVIPSICVKRSQKAVEEQTETTVNVSLLIDHHSQFDAGVSLLI